jgi:hypothetical protein
MSLASAPKVERIEGGDVPLFVELGGLSVAG